MAQPQTYEVTHPDGRTLEITGERMPTESELQNIFKSMPSGGQPSASKAPPTDLRSKFEKRAAELKAADKARPQPLREAIGGAAGAFGAGVAAVTKPLSRRITGQTSEQYDATVEDLKRTSSTAGKVGQVAGQAAEFAIPEMGASKIAGALPTMARAARVGAKEALTAAGTYGVAKSQGDPHAAVTTLTSMVPGFATMGVGSAKAWYASAERTMTRILESAAKARNEKVIKQAVADVLPLAMDRSLLRATKGRWATAVEEAKNVRGQAVKDVLASSVGDEPLPVGPVVKDLETLKQKAMVMKPIGATTRAQVRAGSAGQGLQAVPIESSVVNFIDKMQDRLTSAGGEVGMIQARELVKFKRVWDRFVYGAKPFLDKTALTEFNKEARKAGADAIRRVIATTPSVDVLKRVDEAFHAHTQLYSLISDVAFKVPYVPLAFGVTRQVEKRLLVGALNSPTWRLLSVKAKLAVGDAIASGSAERIRNVLAPIIAGTVKGEPESAEEQ